MIPGKHLSPWVPDPTPGGEAVARPSDANPRRGSILREVWDDVTADNPDVLLAPRIFESVLSVSGVAVPSECG